MFEWATDKWADDSEAIAKEMLTRTDWIWDHDIRDDLEWAVESLRQTGVIESKT